MSLRTHPHPLRAVSTETTELPGFTEAHRIPAIRGNLCQQCQQNHVELTDMLPRRPLQQIPPPPQEGFPERAPF
eukprot:747097-Hanusia_phi.AAC.4